MSTTTTRPKTRSSPRSKKPQPKTPTNGWRVIRWIEAHCVFTNGEWIGRPFKLLKWQKLFILALFSIDPATSLRLYRWALLGVPKKNGKTELAAALALYFLIGDDEPAPLVICAAASDDQADLVFGAAKTMCELSPTLSQITDRYEKEILVPSVPGAKLKRVAAAAGTNDGQNIHAVICDELHEWVGKKGENVWNVLTNGTGARRQPMVLQITTAGYDEDTICYRQYERGRQVEAGLIEDPHFLFRWYEAPPDADYRLPATWEACNPSYGVTVHEPFFHDQLKRKTPAVFKRYFCNVWTDAEEVWISPERWDACNGEPEITPRTATTPGDRVVIGVDAGIKHDSTALCVGALKDGVVHATWHVWTPNESKDEVLDLRVVTNKVRELARDYEVAEVAYDPYFFGPLVPELEDEGLPMVEFPQTHPRMCPASQTLFDLIQNGNLRHGGDEVARKHALAAVVQETERGWRIAKKGTKRKIDALVALAMVVDRLTAEDSSDWGMELL